MLSTGTATSHADLFARLRTFLSTATGSGGAGWTELAYSAGTNRFLTRAPGLSGTDAIHCGFGYVADAGADAFALTGWMFQEYQASFAYDAQPGTSLVRYHPVWDAAIPYWFMANGQRVIIVTKISTTYLASYLGKFLPNGVPGEYPAPYILGMPYSSNLRWSTATADIRSFFDPSTAAQILHQSGNWVAMGNFFQSSGENAASGSGAFVWPYNGNIVNTSDLERWRELRENLDGSYPRFRLQLFGDVPAFEFQGEFDGAFAVPGFSQASEDIVQIGGVDHLVVQDNFRTNRWNYAALALE